MAKCIKCGAEAGPLMAICSACIKAQQSEITQHHAQQEAERVHNEAELNSRADRVICTTAPSLEGYRITQTLEVITAECVFGMNIFRDIFAGLTDLFGGRSEASQKVLRDARRTCLSELKKEAATIGADAVIAVKLDYSEFSGAGKSMLFLVASGTAVKIELSNSHAK